MNPPIDPTLGDASLRQTELNQQQQRIDAMRRNLNTGSPKDKKEKLREACEGFEAIFIQRMWEQMQATVPKEGYLHSKDEKMWQGMYDQELSKKMAGAGGVGLADMMMQQLGKNLEDAGRKTLDTRLDRREPLHIEPAPLLEAAAPAPAAPAAPTDIYSGAAPSVAEVAEAAPVEPQPAPVAPGEFDLLVNQLESQMQQPMVTFTRVTTNTTTLNGPNPVRSGRGMRNPRIQNISPNMGAGLDPAVNAAGAQQVAGMQQAAGMNGAGPAGASAPGAGAGVPASATSTASAAPTPSAAHSPRLADGESAAQLKARQDAMLRDTMIRQAMMGVQSGAPAQAQARKAGS